jgi:hypothetical protein
MHTAVIPPGQIGRCAGLRPRALQSAGHVSRYSSAFGSPPLLLRCALALAAIALVVCTCPAPAQSYDPATTQLSYTLLAGSTFVDDCLVCGRPTICQPMRGSFDLVLLQNKPPYIKYAVKNIDFTASPGSNLERRITGEGVYVRFEEFAVLQDMTLAVQVKDSYTNKLAFFTNNSRLVEKPFPLIQVNLTQTNGSLLQTFSLQILAAPVREIWFSTAHAFVSTNRLPPTNQINPGDLLSNCGRVVRRNAELVQRLGLMPPVYDLGLDALNPTCKGEILFSVPQNVFSESLGLIQHGDLLSDRGAIVKRNQDLLAAFHPPTSFDAGLDAVQLMPDGEYLFSIQSNLVLNSTTTLSRGDVLSDRGRVFLSHQQLLTNFQPAVTNRDFGLDALHILPDGEICFSVEESFLDNRLGLIQSGDLLSNLGYRVLSNQDLLAAFAPADPAKDYGLDALFVVTDAQPPKPPPRIVRCTRSGNLFHLEWDGDGDVFQVEAAPNPGGPWLPCTPVLPDLSSDVGSDSPSASGLFRLRQW